jgi:hypothetical protein
MTPAAHATKGPDIVHKEPTATVTESFRFPDLHPELRLEVYDYVAASVDTCVIRDGHVLLAHPLFLVSRQASAEFISIYKKSAPQNAKTIILKTPVVDFDFDAVQSFLQSLTPTLALNSLPLTPTGSATGPVEREVYIKLGFEVFSNIASFSRLDNKLINPLQRWSKYCNSRTRKFKFSYDFHPHVEYMTLVWLVQQMLALRIRIARTIGESGRDCEMYRVAVRASEELHRRKGGSRPTGTGHRTRTIENRHPQQLRLTNSSKGPSK